MGWSWRLPALGCLEGWKILEIGSSKVFRDGGVVSGAGKSPGTRSGTFPSLVGIRFLLSSSPPWKTNEAGDTHQIVRTVLGFGTCHWVGQCKTQIFRTLESTRLILRQKCGKSLLGNLDVRGSLTGSGSGQSSVLPRKLNRGACAQCLKVSWQGWQRAPGQVTACESLSQLLLSPTLLGRNASLQGQKTDLATDGRKLRHSWAGKASADFSWHPPGLGTQSFCGASWAPATVSEETGPGGKAGQGHYPFQVGLEGISADLEGHSPCPGQEDIDIILEHWPQSHNLKETFFVVVFKTVFHIP